MLIQLVVPTELRRFVLEKYHSEYAGHMGWERTYAALSKCYFWETMIQDIHHYIVRCIECNRNNMGPNRKMPLRPVEIPNKPWLTVGTDIVGPLPTTERGYKYIIVWIDYFTKWPEAFPIKDVDASETISTFVRGVTTRHGYPRLVIADRGSNYTSKNFKTALDRYGAKLELVVTGHHQSNGLVERWNHTLKNVLEKLASENPEEWDEMVQLVCMAYRITPHASTGETPYRMLYGRDMDLANEPDKGPIFAPTVQKYVHHLQSELQLIWHDCHEKIEEAQKRYKEQYDRHVSKIQPEFEIGGLVFLLAKTVQNKGFHPRFEPLFKTLYRIVKIEDYNLTLREINKPEGKEKVVHMDMVKIYLGNEQEYFNYVKGRSQRKRPSTDVCKICFQLEPPRRFKHKRLQSWVACDGAHDETLWYHLECAGLQKPPTKRQSWFCSDCRALKD